MSSVPQAAVSNRLLRLLPPEGFLLLRPSFEPVTFRTGEVIAQPGEPIDHVYFPERGIISVLVHGGDRAALEVGVFGRDGMGPTAVLLGSDSTPHEYVCQAAGSGLRIPSNDLRTAVAANVSLQTIFFRYCQALHVQTAHVALSHSNHTVEERVARRLLVGHDRVDGDDVHLTHELLSRILALQRSGVTRALQGLERREIITARRGTLTITDRAKLEQVARGSYGPPEAEYARLLGPLCKIIGQ